MGDPLRARRVQRPAETSAHGDLGGWLVGIVRRALIAGGAPTAAALVRFDRVDLVLAQDLRKAGAPLTRFLARSSRRGLPDGDPVDVVGIVGKVKRRTNGQDSMWATVFLEWPDCSWWWWMAPIDPVTGDVLSGAEQVRSAHAGDRLPDGLGRWWSQGRRGWRPPEA